MKTILVIGHLWPYSPRGSKRVFGLLKYLPEFGWGPIVISGKLNADPEPGFRVIQTPAPHRIEEIKRRIGLDPHKGIQEQLGIPSEIINRERSVTSRLAKAVEAAITYPDSEAGWKRWALKAVEEILGAERADCMLSVWPIPAHLIAADVKKKHRIPWFADFPDLWSRTYAYRYGPIRRWFDGRLEKRILRGADGLTTSSGPLTEELKRLHGRADVRTIVMGYDPERVNDPPAPVTDTFSITYTGIFYGVERNPSKFLAGLREFLNRDSVDRSRVKVRFFGPRAVAVQQDIERAGLSAVVRQFGIIPWDECLARQRESQILLHLNWENPKEKGAYSGKITEYLAARRPVLSVGGSGGDVIEDLFHETKCGAYCVTPEQVADALSDYYRQFEKDGTVAFRGDLDRIEGYSYRKMAREFASLFSAACAH